MRQEGYTREELDALPLLPITRGQEIIGYVDIDHPCWTGDRDEFLTAMADPENQTSEFLAVKRCSASVKMKKDTIYFPFNRFAVTLNKGKATWEASVRDFENQASREQARSYRERNLPFLRMYAMGNIDARIRCPIFDFQIDAISLFGVESLNAWVQHHFRFVNGVSVHKENADPGAILSSTDFTVPSPRSRDGIKDMARTIFLSSTAHDALHKCKRSGDINDYTNDQLPWALRNQDNWEAFNAFLITFGHDHLGDYQTWFNDQKN